MTMKELGGRLETVAALASLLVTLAACGGKVIGDDPSHGCPTSLEPAATATSAPVASSTPSGEPTASPPPTSTSIPPVVSTDAGSPVVDSGAVVPALDGGVFDDGDAGSLVAIARTACAFDSAVSALVDGGAPATVGRELATCASAAGQVTCVSNDGVQCSDATNVTLLFDLSCVDRCSPSEYVATVQESVAILYRPPPALAAAGCRQIDALVGTESAYCCPCVD